MRESEVLAVAELVLPLRETIGEQARLAALAAGLTAINAPAAAELGRLLVAEAEQRRALRGGMVIEIGWSGEQIQIIQK